MSTITQIDPLAQRHPWLSEMHVARVRQGEARSKPDPAPGSASGRLASGYMRPS